MKIKRRSTTVPENFTARLDGVDYGVLDDLFGFNIRRAQIVIYSDYFTKIGDTAITPQRFAALSIIGSNAGLRQVKLAHILGVARPGATVLVDFWQDRDCVQRREGVNDRRSYGIYLTQTGQAKLAHLTQLVREHEAEIFSPLSNEEQIQLRALLEKIYQ